MEREWADFRVIKAAVSMQMLIDHYGLQGLRKSSSELRGAARFIAEKGSELFTSTLARMCFSVSRAKLKATCWTLLQGWNMEHP